jgi:hypothetical protein
MYVPGVTEDGSKQEGNQVEPEALDAEGEVQGIKPTSSVDVPPVTSPSATNDLERKWLVSPRLVAIAAVIFGMACLTSLAVVAAVGDDPALATIALALAVLAFGVQLLVYVAEAQSTTQQMLRSEQLNTQTSSLLTEMQTSARSTEAMVRDQFSQLLRAFLDAAQNAGGGGKDFDPDAFERRLMANIRQEAALRGEPRPSQPAGGPSRPTRSRSRLADISRVYDAGPFPDEAEARPVLNDLLALSGPARERLRLFGRDKQNIQAGSQAYEGYAPNPADDQLKERGLVKLVRLAPEEYAGSPTAPQNGIVHQLTEKGERAARVLGSSGPVPPWAEALFPDPE